MPGTLWNRQQGRPDRSVGLKSPLKAPGLGTQRMYNATGTADKNLIVDHRGLGKCRDIAVKGERPQKLESTNLIDVQAGGFDGLIARVICGGTPTVPYGLWPVGDRHTAIATVSTGGI